MKDEQKPLFLVATLGIVYGDIGTSPLYALKNCFNLYNLPVNTVNILGIISLIFWSLFIVVSCKYTKLILKADNQGEGGILALLTACTQHSPAVLKSFIFTMGIIGAALFYGDGVITPAISVVGALEGISLISDVATPYIPHLAACILIGLFLIQKKGSQSIGSFFGPLMIVWFSVLALLGIFQIFNHLEILKAISPYYAIKFIQVNGLLSLLTFGAIVLVVAGVEALYADLGHFNLRSIKLTWTSIVFPALVLNYFGQGALLLDSPDSISNPFYLMAPSWGLYPLIILSTLATIIASQAVISGIFSISWQAIQLGFFPRMNVIHTSAQQIGQVYLPVINYLLLTGTLVTVAVFKNTENMTAAYGIAITGIMFISSILALLLARYAWNWSLFKIFLIFTPLLVLDSLFFSTNAIKILNGGWFPILIAGSIYYTIQAWKNGREALIHERSLLKEDLKPYLKHVIGQSNLRIPGTAIFMCRSPLKVPATLDVHLKHNKYLHDQVIFLSIITEKVPKSPKEQRIKITDYGQGVFQITAHFGYVEVPDLGFILNLIKKEGVSLNRHEVTFFLSRGVPVPSGRSYLSGAQEILFMILSHNSANATDYYHIPYDQVVEYGVRFEI